MAWGAFPLVLSLAALLSPAAAALAKDDVSGAVGEAVAAAAAAAIPVHQNAR